MMETGMSSMHEMAGPDMSGIEAPSLPDGYPDPAVVGRARTEDLEFAGLHIRMTIAPGERLVRLWELVDGHPVRWLGIVFRVDSEPPVLRLGHPFESRVSRPRRDDLARIGAKFWKG
jgi:hypothetical protein